jgi:hypothetical protein
MTKLAPDDRPAATAYPMKGFALDLGIERGAMTGRREVGM